MFWDYAKGMGLYTIVAICLLYLGHSAAAIGASVWLSAWSDEAMVEGRQNNTSVRLGVCAALGVLQGERAETAGGIFLTSGVLDPSNDALDSVFSSIIPAIVWPQCLPNPP